VRVILVIWRDSLGLGRSPRRVGYRTLLCALFEQRDESQRHTSLHGVAERFPGGLFRSRIDWLTDTHVVQVVFELLPTIQADHVASRMGLAGLGYGRNRTCEAMVGATEEEIQN